MLKDFLLIGLGGGIGSIVRQLCVLYISSKNFPYSILFINIFGSFLIGIIFAISLKSENFNQHWKLFLATGICGGFTTFSAFSLENMNLIQAGKYNTALVYILLSIVISIVATFIGFKIIH